MNRICICVKDIQQITGKSERQCRNIMNKIKEEYQKLKHQVVTLDEFCQYMGLHTTYVERFLK